MRESVGTISMSARWIPMNPDRSRWVGRSGRLQGQLAIVFFFLHALHFTHFIGYPEADFWYTTLFWRVNCQFYIDLDQGLQSPTGVFLLFRASIMSRPPGIILFPGVFIIRINLQYLQCSSQKSFLLHTSCSHSFQTPALGKLSRNKKRISSTAFRPGRSLFQTYKKNVSQSAAPP